MPLRVGLHFSYLITLLPYPSYTKIGSATTPIQIIPYSCLNKGEVCSKRSPSTSLEIYLLPRILQICFFAILHIKKGLQYCLFNEHFKI